MISLYTERHYFLILSSLFIEVILKHSEFIMLDIIMLTETTSEVS